MEQHLQLDRIPQALPGAAQHPIHKRPPQLAEGGLNALAHLTEHEVMLWGTVAWASCACHETACRAFQESRPRRPGRGTAAKDPWLDGPWRGCCPVLPSHNSHSADGGRNGAGCPPCAGIPVWRRSAVVGQKGEPWCVAAPPLHRRHSRAHGSAPQRVSALARASLPAWWPVATRCRSHAQDSMT
jgi:hypothetical protein